MAGSADSPPKPGIEGLKAANSLVAQIVTVAATLLAFTVTFAEKFTAPSQPIVPPPALKISWCCFAVTMLFGFWALMASTGTLNVIDAGEPEANPKRWNIRIPAALTIFAFLAGVLFLIVAGWAIVGPGT